MSNATTRFSLLLEAQSRGTEEIKKFSDAIDKVVGAAEKGNKRAKESFDLTAANVKSAIQDPLNTAGAAAEKFLLTFGKVGVAATGAAVGLGVAVKASFDLVKQTGDAAEQMINLADRTGLTLNQVDKLQAMSKIAGISITSLEQSSRVLAEGLADAGSTGDRAREAFRKLGVITYDASGAQRELGQVTLDVIERLASVRGDTERVTLATATLGRGAKELQPLLKNYEELKRTVEAMGFGMDEYLLKRMAGAADEIDKLGLRWDLLKRRLAIPAKAVVDVVLDTLSPGKIAPTLDPNDPKGVLINWGPRGAPQPLTAIDFGKFDTRRRLAQEFETTYRNTPEGMKDTLTEISEKLVEINVALKSGALSYEDHNKKLAERNRLLAQTETLQFRIAYLEKNKGPFVLNEPDKIPRRRIIPSLRGPTYGGTEFTPGTFMIDEGLYNQVNAQSSAQAQARIAGMLERETSDREKARALAKAEMEYQVRRISLLTGPDGEVEALNRITALRLENLRLTEDLQDVEMRRTEILREREIQILEIRQRGMEQYKSSVQAGFNALLSGGASGLGAFVKSQGLGILSQAAGNVAGMTYGAMAGRFALPGVLGKVFQGTPFGADPLKSATDLNTMATERNTAALMETSRAMVLGATTGGSGGIAMGIPSGGTALDSIFGRLGEPGIASASKHASLYKSLGIAGAAGGGAFGVMSGIGMGGARGAMTASGSALAAGGAIASLASKALSWMGPAGMVAGMALGLATQLFGDPKIKRREALEEEAQRRAYTEPTGAAYSMDVYGRSLDYNYRGGLRPIIVNQYNVQATDVKSFLEWGKQHGAEFAEVTSHAINSGNAEDLLGILRQSL